MLGMFRRKPQARAGYALYTAAVQAAREPAFYDVLGVPDTLDGRFDLVGVHVFMLIDRLRDAEAPGPDLAQAVFDAMFSDMDFNLREMGVSDMRIGRRVKEMWEAFHGRAMAYQEAVVGEDDAALADALARNVWRGVVAPDGAAAALAALVRRDRARLAALPMSEFVSGTAVFLEPTFPEPTFPRPTFSEAGPEAGLVPV